MTLRAVIGPPAPSKILSEESFYDLSGVAHQVVQDLSGDIRRRFELMGLYHTGQDLLTNIS